jgi:hypothetical protein
MDVFRTFIIPSNLVATAVAIVDALGYPEKGMFTAEVVDVDKTVGYIASGWVPENSVLLGPVEALQAATKLPLIDCQAFLGILDLTTADPFSRMETCKQEAKTPPQTAEWVKPVDERSAYKLDDCVTYVGKKYRSIMDLNMMTPGTKGWRELFVADAKADGASEVKPK